MTRDREHDQTEARRQRDLDSNHIPAPGKLARTDGLTGGAGVRESGLIQRKARDANGVADGAHEAVATASAGSGSQLPETLMRKFESSLGTELSSVRVHTGAESATAANAVGARAYTMGQDIHFGAGHYDPASADGQHLLAHEVAHTVQQRGGSAIRQNKLEVSAPGDAAEHEADRAADAMTTGAAFAVTRTGGGLARDPITLPVVEITGERPRTITLPEVEIESEPTGPADTDKMAKSADSAQKSAEEHAGHGGGVIGDAAAVTVQNKQDADRLIALINSDSGKIEQGIAAHDIEPSVRMANQQAVATLSTYSDTLDADKFNTDSFQQQAQILSADFARLHAQMITFDKSGQGSGAVSDVAGKMAPGAARGEKLGGTVIEQSSGQSAATLNNDFKKTITAGDKDAGHSTNATAQWANAQKCEKDMHDAETLVAQGSRDFMPKQAAAQSAAANIKAIAAGAEGAAHQSDIDGLKAKAAEAEEKIKLVGGTIKGIASLAGAVAKPDNVSGIVGAAVDLVTNLASYAAKHWNDSDIKDEEEKKKVSKANEIFQRAKEASTAAVAAVGELRNAALAYADNLGKLADAKTKYREAMQLMGKSLDNVQGGNSFGIIAQVLSEAEPYLVQSKLAIETGRNAVGKLPAGQGGPRRDKGTTGSVTYYLGVAPPDGHTFFATRGSYTMKGSLTSADQPAGGDLTKVVEKLEQERDEIEGLAKSLRAVFKP